MASAGESGPAEDKGEQDAAFVASKEAYFASLRAWVARAQTAQASALLPYYFMAYQMLFHLQSTQQQQQAGAGYVNNNNYQQRVPPPPPYSNRHPPPLNRPPGIEYVIPPIWKRVVAEFFDFFFFLMSKLLLYYVADNYLGILEAKNMNGMRTMNLLKRMSEDYDFDLELTSELFILEMVNRVVACIFETVFISENAFFGLPWGGTPGKFIMGLRVVSATTIVPSPNQRPGRESAYVYPGTLVSFRTALVRSAIKNVLISLILPICMLVFFFQHNRTTYDVMANVIVVETPPEENEPPRNDRD